MSWATDDGWEDSSWGVIATEASLDHSGSIVDHEGSYLFLRIRHVEGLYSYWERKTTMRHSVLTGRVWQMNESWSTFIPSLARVSWKTLVMFPHLSI